MQGGSHFFHSSAPMIYTMPRSHSFNSKWRASFAAIIIMLLVCTGFDAAAQQQKKRRGKPAKTPATQQTDSNSNAATTTPPKPQKKNLAALRGSDSPAGGRATITSDVPLNDYEAYRSGNRYYVVIPQANAPSATGGLRGRGYDDVQVHKRGNDTVLSFRLKPGTTAHVNQKFNRLEVVFNSPGDASSANATGTTTPSGTSGSTTPASGNTNNSRPGPTPTQNGNTSASPTGGSTSTPGANTSLTGTSAVTGGTPPLTTVSPDPTASLPTVTPALGPTAEVSPVAPSPTPPTDQLAQTQPAPSVPTAVTTPPAATGTSLGAVLRSNWLLVLIAALLLITVGLVAMTRARSRRTTDEKITERKTPAIKEGALESVEAAPVREASPVEAVAAAGTVDEALALESPSTADETQTLEVEPANGLNVEHVRLEIKHVLTGQEYDESVINTPIKETRQLIESELLFALSKRNTERRDRALKAFTEHGYFDDATRDLRTAEVPAERAAAARKLGLTRDTTATPHLAAALEDSTPEVRRAAVEALAELSDPEAIGPLESLLKREEDRKVPHALIQRAIRASAAAAAASTSVEEEPPATIDVETATQEEAVTLEAAPVAVEEVESPAAEAALPVEDLAETPGIVEESLASVPETSLTLETAGQALEAEPASTTEPDVTRAEALTESSSAALPIASALVEGIVTAEAAAAERQRAEADAARIHAEQERVRTEEARRQEEERQLELKRAEEERVRAEAEAERQREAAEAERLRAEEEQARTEAEALRQAEEERKRVEKEARLKAFEEERQRAEEARRLRAEERERRRAEEEKARLEEQERERAEADAARRRAEEAALRLADMRRRAEEEARLREEAEAERQRKEEETRQLAEAEAARQRAEKEEAEARQREEQELERQRAAEARRLEEEERHRRLEQERLRAEEERRRTEEEARRQEEERQLELQRAEEERVRAEAEAERQREAAEAERLRAEEEQARAEAEARRHVEEERRRVEEEERQRAEAEAARIQFEQEAAEQRRREEAAANAAMHIEIEEAEPDYAGADRPVVQSELFESTVADQASFMPPLETSKGIVEHSASDWVDVDFNEPEAVGDEQPTVSAAPTVVNEAAIVEHTGAEALSVESIEEYGTVETAEEVKGIELATPGYGGGPYAEDEFASVPGGILRRLGSEVASERAAAVTDLARVGGDDAFREISAAFDDPAQLVRDAAARALFDLQADHAASFTRALREAPSDRRRRIGNALASSGLATEAIGHLMGESREKTYDAFSLLFLMSKAGEVQPLMRAIEEHPNSEVRLAVVKLLALSGQQDILPAFRRLAVRGSLPTEVRSAVMEAIYQISSQASSDTSPVA